MICVLELILIAIIIHFVSLNSTTYSCCFSGVFMYLMADASADINLYDHGQETSDRHVTGLLWPQSL